MTQQNLPGIRIAPQAVAITTTYSWHSGWSLRVSWRASGQPGWTTRDYSGLTSPELVDVASAELEQLLVAGRDLASGGAAAAE